MITIEKLNEVYLKINCEKSIAYEIKDLFSCLASNYKFHPKFKARIWDGRISMFNYKENLLPIGLLQPLLKHFDDNEYEYSLKFELSELINDSLTPEITHTFLQKIFANSDKPPRDYQEESVHSCLVNKKGVIESPTGSGKSLIIYAIIRALLEADNKILLIVPNISLVNQMYSDFQEYGWKDCEEFVDILYSGKKLSGKPILVSTYQSLVNKSEQFLAQFNGILIDECHGVKDASKSLKSIIHKCQNAEYRFGFTGTLPEEDIDVLTINSYLGDVLFNQTTGELIDQGILSQIEIVNLLYKYAPNIVEKNKNRSYPEEERFIEGFEHRNKIFNFIFENVSEGENTLILCRHIEHLKKIERYLLDNLDDKYKVLVIYGEIKPEVRENIRKLMDVEKNIILVGSYSTLSTGINIKRIHHIIFAASYKAKTKVLQAIGRGLRTHSEKEKMILWDIIDDLSWIKRTGKQEKNYVLEHFDIRLEYYKKQGFSYNTLQISDSDLKN